MAYYSVVGAGYEERKSKKVNTSVSCVHRDVAGTVLLRFGWAGVVGILLLIEHFAPIPFLPWGLMLGGLLVAPLFAGMQNVVLVSAAGRRVGWRDLFCGSLRSWLVAGAVFPCIIFLFLAGVYYLTLAFPLSGSLTYLFVTLGTDILVGGWFDLLTVRLLMAVLMFLLCLGWVYVPILAVRDAAGVIGSLGRSWRMVHGHRARLFAHCIRALGLPLAASLVATVLGILQFAQPLAGPTAQWIGVAALLVLVVWGGPRLIKALMQEYPSLLPVDRADIKHVRRVKTSPFSRQRDPDL